MTVLVARVFSTTLYLTVSLTGERDQETLYSQWDNGSYQDDRMREMSLFPYGVYFERTKQLYEAFQVQMNDWQ